MSIQSIYRSPEGEAAILALYDRFLDRLGVECESVMVGTRFGATHVLVTGPGDGPPVVMLHGGNSTTPHALTGFLPILKTHQYRVYAPDTIGHPGRSAQTRLSSSDDSYGWWLADVLDGLGLERAMFAGGSFGAGILLRLAAVAPERIIKAALVVPSGFVNVPALSMAFKLGLPYLIYRLRPDRKRLVNVARALAEEVDEDLLLVTEAAFRHVSIAAQMPRPATKEELAGFNAPVLVLAGEKDIMFPGEAVVRRAREIIPNLAAAECIEGGTHQLSKEKREYVNRRIQEFLGEML